MIILALTLVAMVVIVTNQWRSIHAYPFQMRTDLFAVALVGVVLLFFLDAFGWHIILKSLGLRPDVRHSIRTWMLSSITRYLPGGVWGYVSRASLSLDSGISLGQVSLGLYLETLLLLLSSLAAGMPALWSASGLPLRPGYAIVVALGLGMLLHPRIVTLLRHLPGRAGRAFTGLVFPSMGRTLALYAYYLLFWVLFGLIFVVFVSAFEPLRMALWIPVASSIALGFAVGFVLVFFPSGVGIRESALYALLLPWLPATTCLVVSLGSRLWIMAGEAISVAVAELLYRFRSRSLRNHR